LNFQGNKRKREIQLIPFRREIKGTHNIVVATISMLKEIINNTEWDTAKYELLLKLLHHSWQHLPEHLCLFC